MPGEARKGKWVVKRINDMSSINLAVVLSTTEVRPYNDLVEQGDGLNC